MVDIIFWKSNDFRDTLYSRAFEVADYEFDIGFHFSKWRIQFGGHEILETTIFAQLCTRGFSGSLIMNFKLDFQHSI